MKLVYPVLPMKSIRNMLIGYTQQIGVYRTRHCRDGAYFAQRTPRSTQRVGGLLNKHQFVALLSKADKHNPKCADCLSPASRNMVAFSVPRQQRIVSSRQRMGDNLPAGGIQRLFYGALFHPVRG